ncbi:MAG: ATP-binding protein [Myxococcota bacterium]
MAAPEAEERYQRLIANAPFGVLLVRQGVIVRVNAALCRILGCDHEAHLAGRPVLDIIHPDFRVVARERLGKLMSGQAVLVEPLEQLLIRRDGTMASVIIYGQAVTIDGEPHIQGFIADISERVAIEDELRRTRDSWARTFDVVDDAIVIYSTDRRVTLMNQRARGLFDALFVEIDGRAWLRQFHPGGMPNDTCPSCAAFRTAQPTTFELIDNEGGRVFEGRAFPWVAPGGAIESVVLVIRDVTAQRHGEQQRRSLELQLLQAHKMESIGRLAGGIAHDFNNLLTAILGYCDVALAKLPDGHPVIDAVQRVRGAGERAADLTRQLLAFGRKQVLVTQPTDINAVITALLRIVERIIGEDITVETRLAASLPGLLVDPGQIEQVLLNLVVNARDAMPTGGRVIIATDQVLLGDGDREAWTQALTESPAPGAYVRLTVHDTGVGIPASVLPLVFEPFYTTKPRDRGTGLGLATVHGVVKQHHGHVGVTSQRGQGTTFTVLLPVTSGPTTELTERAPDSELVRGNETVLVVDDDELVRQLVTTVLDALGYRVLSASDGPSALTLLQQPGENIDLLLTDVVMPTMHGVELAERSVRRQPSLKIAFMSGYADGHLPPRAAQRLGAELLEKPLTPVALARFVRAQLDRTR